jgi:hypothetical protein
MISLVLCLFAAQPGPGPLDAFQANYTSIKAEVTYVHTKGYCSPEVVSEGRLWAGMGIDFVEETKKRIIGKWRCDGLTEYFDFSSPEDVTEEGRAKKRVIGEKVPFIPRTEALWNGETLVANCLEPDFMPGGMSIVHAWHTGEPGMAGMGRSPFFWWGSYPFPQIVTVHFPEKAPTRHRSVRNGHPTEVEVYQKANSDGGWLRIEISYDPLVGYLPRYGRFMVLTGAKEGLIKEFYLIAADRCRAGGFVPTEWYDTMFFIPDFPEKYPDYDHDTVLKPVPPARVTLGHFRTPGFLDRPQPVALEHLGQVEHIALNGELIPLPRGTTSLTFDRFKTIVGDRLKRPREDK